jgi:hypothetical protein
MTTYYGSLNSIGSIVDAVALYSDGEFKSSTRSTIPMLTLLLHGRRLFDDIAAHLGLPNDCDLFLEYTVRPPRGRGTSSHTDVMLKASASALAIEGKWTEPMYESVGTWLKNGNDPTNRQTVRDGWLSLLQRHVKTPLTATDFDTVVYQMLHRAASAAVAEKPSLAYIVFKPSPDRQSATADSVAVELLRLWTLLGRPASFPFYVVEIEIMPTDAYEPLRLLPKGQDSTAQAVKAALYRPEPLFSFKNSRIRRIGEEAAAR